MAIQVQPTTKVTAKLPEEKALSDKLYGLAAASGVVSDVFNQLQKNRELKRVRSVNRLRRERDISAIEQQAMKQADIYRREATTEAETLRARQSRYDVDLNSGSVLGVRNAFRATALQDAEEIELNAYKKIYGLEIEDLEEERSAAVGTQPFARTAVSSILTRGRQFTISRLKRELSDDSDKLESLTEAVNQLLEKEE